MMDFSLIDTSFDQNNVGIITITVHKFRQYAYKNILSAAHKMLQGDLNNEIIMAINAR